MLCTYTKTRILFRVGRASHSSFTIGHLKGDVPAALSAVHCTALHLGSDLALRYGPLARQAMARPGQAMAGHGGRPSRPLVALLLGRAQAGQPPGVLSGVTGHSLQPVQVCNFYTLNPTGYVFDKSGWFINNIMQAT
jgi:hypothetical protein